MIVSVLLAGIAIWIAYQVIQIVLAVIDLMTGDDDGDHEEAQTQDEEDQAHRGSVQ